jgi:hypothetical protein
MIEMAWSTVARQAIVPFQDLLELGAEARMNIPGLCRRELGLAVQVGPVKGKAPAVSERNYRPIQQDTDRSAALQHRFEEKPGLFGM